MKSRLRLPKDKPARPVHEGLWIGAVVVGLVGPGLIAIGRLGSTFDVQDGALLSGVITIATLACFIFLVPYRRSSRFFAAGNAPARLFLAYGLIWLLLGLSIPILRWHEVDPHEPTGPVIGVVLLVASGFGAIGLWAWLRTADPRGDVS